MVAVVPERTELAVPREVVGRGFSYKPTVINENKKEKAMKKKLLLSAMALTLLLTGCGQPAASPTPTEVAPEPTATVEPTPEPTATLEPTPEPVSTFEEAPCSFDMPEGQTVECGFVVVPEDHSDPNGPTIRLAVAVF